MISDELLGSRMAQARERLRRTRSDVARNLGISEDALVAMENGEKRPSNNELFKLSKVLAISLHELLGAHPAPHAKEWLLEAYEEALFSEGEVAHHLGCDRLTVRELHLSRQVTS